MNEWMMAWTDELKASKIMPAVKMTANIPIFLLQW